MSIRTTVEESLTKQGVPLSPQYAGYANHVIEALQTREAEIVSNLTMFAVEQGLSREDARDAMADCGLEVDASAIAVAEDPRIAAMEETLNALQETLRQMRA